MVPIVPLQMEKLNSIRGSRGRVERREGSQACPASASSFFFPLQLKKNTDVPIDGTLGYWLIPSFGARQESVTLETWVGTPGISKVKSSFLIKGSVPLLIFLSAIFYHLL